MLKYRSPIKLLFKILFLCATFALSTHTVVHGQSLKKLPIDTSSFNIIVKNNYLYVDKTEYIHNLIKADRHYFLVRPRRFGRSLFLSTLQEIFSGNKDLFAEYWIGKTNDYTWTKHPVIKLDFLMIDDSSPEKFETCLRYKIHMLAEEHGITMEQHISLEDAIVDFIQKLSLQGTIVLLIDEYDKPLRKHQLHQKSFEKINCILKNFYTTLGKLDHYFRAIMITGVVPYSISMIRAAVPQLKNISYSPEASHLFGFTTEEINTTLLPYIMEYSNHKAQSIVQILKEFENSYGGYRFTPGAKSVYSPTPILYSLNRREKYSEWKETATPTFLSEFITISPQQCDYENLYQTTISLQQISEPHRITIVEALFYAGFLTIGSHQPSCNTFILKPPHHNARAELARLFPLKSKDSP